MTDHPPSEIRLHTVSRLLSVLFDNGRRYEIPFEYLRVNSPSAEVQGHGPGQKVKVTGKEAVLISRIEPVGLYAVKLVFDDGHDSGLYTWKILRELGEALEKQSPAATDPALKDLALKESAKEKAGL